MEKEVNLEKILANHLTFNKNWVLLHNIKKAMHEACKQVLDLAAENGKVAYVSDRTNEKTWLSTTEKKHYVLDKQSITDIINQIII